MSERGREILKKLLCFASGFFILSLLGKLFDHLFKKN